jgi:hypothetical protein
MKLCIVRGHDFSLTVKASNMPTTPAVGKSVPGHSTKVEP